jgi:TATA-binding protein-associated factor Taf7
MPKAFSVE